MREKHHCLSFGRVGGLSMVALKQDGGPYWLQMVFAEGVLHQLSDTVPWNRPVDLSFFCYPQRVVDVDGGDIFWRLPSLPLDPPWIGLYNEHLIVGAVPDNMLRRKQRWITPDGSPPSSLCLFTMVTNPTAVETPHLLVLPAQLVTICSTGKHLSWVQPTLHTQEVFSSSPSTSQLTIHLNHQKCNLQQRFTIQTSTPTVTSV